MERSWFLLMQSDSKGRVKPFLSTTSSIVMIGERLTLRVFSDTFRGQPHPLSGIKPCPLNKQLAGIHRPNQIVVYALKTNKVCKGFGKRTFYTLERFSDPLLWSSPFDGDVIGVCGYCLKDRWQCKDDFACLTRALDEAGQLSELSPTPLPYGKYGKEEVDCFKLRLPAEATPNIPVAGRA